MLEIRCEVLILAFSFPLFICPSPLAEKLLPLFWVAALLIQGLGERLQLLELGAFWCIEVKYVATRIEFQF